MVNTSIKNYWKIVQSSNPRRLIIAFSYDPKWVTLVKSIPDRKYDPSTKTWNIPSTEINRVVGSLKHHKIPYTIDERISETIQRKKQEDERLIDIKFGKGLIDLPVFPTPPYAYQHLGISYLVKGKRCILADDMGLGKTISSLYASQILGVGPILILCPSTLKWNWEKELNKHLPGVSYSLVHGTKVKREKQWNVDTSIYICSYELLRYDTDTIRSKKFQLIIADEATRLKNHVAQTTKIVKSLKVPYRFALTGTPIENKVEELHSILDWCQPGLLGSKRSFLERYAILDFFGNVVRLKPEGISELRRTVAPYILRRTKDEVLTELPPKLRQDVTVEFSTAERRMYKELVKEILREMGEEVMSSPMVKTLRAKQFTSCPRVLGYEFDGPKFKELETIFKEGEGHKFLVFSEFAEVVKRLAAVFSAPAIYGDVKQPDRQKIIDSFNEDKKQLVLFSSSVANYGVEITGADVVVHLDAPWNPAVRDQREDRVHRPGQVRPVNVIRLAVRNSVDDRIDKVIASKLNIRSQVLDDIDYEASVRRFTKKDWEAALLDDDD